MDEDVALWLAVRLRIAAEPDAVQLGTRALGDVGGPRRDLSSL
jgi:hypothetical protein